MRLHTGKFLGLGAALVALIHFGQLQGQDKPPADLPPWKLMLKAEDAKKVNELESLSEELESKGKYQEAMKPLSEVIAIRTNRQGPKHWQTIDAQQELTSIRRRGLQRPRSANKWTKQTRHLIGRIASRVPAIRRPRSRYGVKR